MTSRKSVSGKIVDLWLVDLARSGDELGAVERETPRLGAADRASIAAIRDGQERRRRLAAHIALRVVLERVAGEAVRGQDLVRESGGRPRLPGIEFSLSHTDDLALIAAARGVDVGVDLERVRFVRVSLARRRRILDAAGMLSETPLDVANGEEAFIRAWVRIEAVAKATGEGLARTLTALGAWHGAVPAADAARGYLALYDLTVHDVTLAPRVVGAVALGGAANLPPVTPFPHDRAGIERLLQSRSG
jgi:4'-phosphopantetheinyl transferase